MNIVKNYHIIKQVSEHRYEAQDINTNEHVEIERYKDISISDWNKGKKINDELRKLKVSNKLKDYFYVESKDHYKKVFYKVYSREPDEKEEVFNFENIKRKSIILKPICEVCSNPISIRKINPTKNNAFCGRCHRETSFIMVEPKTTIKENLRKPKSLSIKAKKGKFVIKITSHKLMAFTLLLTLITLTYLKYHFTGKDLTTIDLYIVLGASAIIALIKFNGKYIEIKNGSLTVASKPFRLSKIKEVSIDNLNQLYVKKAARSEFDIDTNYRSKKLYFSTYFLKAILEDNTHIVLYKTNNPVTASYIEYQIEEYLHIHDRIVPGEYDINTDMSFQNEIEL